jgi:hypothetical protein
VGAPAGLALRDVWVTARFHKLSGPLGGGYGIIVRDVGPGPRDGVQQRGSYYVFEAGDRGEYGVWRRSQDDWIDLIPWTASPAVQPGTGSNELTVFAEGDRLKFLINGVEVAQFSDTVLAEGGVGVFAGGDMNEVVLDRFSVQTIR